MTNSTLSPTKVTVSSFNETVTVTFEDGHHVVFVGYSHALGYQVDGLRQFFIYNHEELVVQYDARLQRIGPSPNEHRFVKVATDYPIERIVEYWETAKQHIKAEYGVDSDEMWYAWMISCEGWADLNAIKAGRKPLP